jgi:hypothetical protein
MGDDLRNLNPSQIGQTFMFDANQLKLKSPFKIMIAGQSGTYS